MTEHYCYRVVGVVPREVIGEILTKTSSELKSRDYLEAYRCGKPARFKVGDCWYCAEHYDHLFKLLGEDICD